MSRVVTAAHFFVNLVGSLLILGPLVVMIHQVCGALDLDVFQILMMPALSLVGTALMVISWLMMNFERENK